MNVCFKENLLKYKIILNLLVRLKIILTKFVLKKEITRISMFQKKSYHLQYKIGQNYLQKNEEIEDNFDQFCTEEDYFNVYVSKKIFSSTKLYSIS